MRSSVTWRTPFTAGSVSPCRRRCICRLPQQPDPPSSMSISVRAAGGSPALLTKSRRRGADGREQRHRDHVPSALGAGQCLTDPGADGRDAVGFLRRLALLLAGLGLYGVTSYAVSRRRTEIGIRMALGAAPGGVVRMVLRRVALLVGIGIVVGAGVSLWASRFVSTLLFGLQPRDPSRSSSPRLGASRRSARWRAGFRRAARRASIRRGCFGMDNLSR